MARHQLCINIIITIIAFITSSMHTSIFITSMRIIHECSPRIGAGHNNLFACQLTRWRQVWRSKHMSSSNSTAVDVTFVVAVVPVEARQFDILVIATEIGWYEIFLTILLILFNLISAIKITCTLIFVLFIKQRRWTSGMVYKVGSLLSSSNFCKHEG